MKTYVTLDIVRNLLREADKRHGLFNTNPDVWDLNQGDWERDRLAPQIGEDPRLAARLSLWARQVAGEVLGLAHTTLFTRPALARGPDTADGIAALVTKRHNERMAQIDLRA